MSDLYVRILRGYDEVVLPTRKVYIKHSNQLDNVQIKEKIDLLTAVAIKEGHLPEKKKLETAKKLGLWSDQQEGRFQTIPAELSNLRKSVSKLVVPYQIKQVEDRITQVEFELLKLRIERQTVIGDTAELVGDRRAIPWCVYLCTYSDPQLKERAFTEEGVEEDLTPEVESAFFKSRGLCTSEELEKLACSWSFRSLVTACGNNIYSFYGKPAVELSDYQASLFTSAQAFNRIYENYDVPPDIEGDPKAIWKFVQDQGKKKQAIKTASSSVPRTDGTNTKYNIEQVSNLASQNGGEFNLRSIKK